jgi:hypothetical protein
VESVFIVSELRDFVQEGKRVQTAGCALNLRKSGKAFIVFCHGHRKAAGCATSEAGALRSGGGVGYSSLSGREIVAAAL